ncbi:MAG: rRNA adenine methyltransferase [Leptolyngbya foveolarum]|uniref:rRNA adenine methyltransferase n=1 Tax=Leptolyngbya foveolarum TaxID=47253 RepID=A0A2W4UAA8_9CYAN|nr:MAG: rRNA adenine methyltransferase [Leptolyngbya foveolarum]
MIDEGVVKYRCDWEKIDAVQPSEIVELNRYRYALHQLNLIGEYSSGPAKGIGFGNISQRLPHSPYSALPFIISGTQTGHLPTLTAADYAKVTAFDPAQNYLTCQGLRQASSESLTHGVIYAQSSSIHAIIHVHHLALWQQLLHQVPTTRATVPYGTPEMAAETQRLFKETELPHTKVFAMAGHEEGIVAFGETLQIAYRKLINWGILTQLIPESALQLPY